MSTTKVKFLTACDSNFFELSDISGPTVREFCHKNGYGFSEILIDNFSRPPAWFKIQLILRELGGDYDYLVWIDSDAAILKNDFNIFENIDSNKLIHFGSDFNGINSGFFIVKDCGFSLQFFTEAWGMTEYLHHIWWEQAAIIDLYEKNYLDCQKKIEILDQSIFNSYPMEFFARHKGVYGDISDKTFVCHFPSLPLDMRKNLMKDTIDSIIKQ